MKEKEVNITTTQKVYELTKDEMDLMKESSYREGVYDANHYILYCVCNTKYKMNLWWIKHFLSELNNFVSGRSNMIENTKNITFQQYIDGKR